MSVTKKFKFTLKEYAEMRAKGLKYCPQCDTIKNINCFANIKNLNGTNRPAGWCKSCRLRNEKKIALSRDNNPEKKKQFSNRKKELKYKTSESYIRFMLYAAKGRAAAKGLDFNLSIEDITIPEICPILNIPLQISKGPRKNNSPSLDRINNSKGYTRDNTRVISWRANHLKHDGTLEEFKKLTSWMEGNIYEST